MGKLSKRALEHKERLEEIKTFTPCADCDETYHPAAMDIHHLDPSEKLGSIASMLGLPRSELQAELDKCILLCSNCHRTRHAKMRDASN